ncbi:hypothetical protein AB990_17950 [Alkalihalobacillus pseudalcaliphilus]|nr:hypothetical protein AB990_17950 [Alkalihalobacillus pseudalcaliphilus]
MFSSARLLLIHKFKKEIQHYPFKMKKNKGKVNGNTPVKESNSTFTLYVVTSRLSLQHSAPIE